MASATRTNGVPEAVIDDETGVLVEPGNGRLAAAIAALLRIRSAARGSLRTAAPSRAAPSTHA
ncbi:MAG: hypothetical protein R2712_27300 [Vicinamibacterales bacterium]